MQNLESIFLQIKSDTLNDEHVTTGSNYAYNIIRSLDFKASVVSDLWKMVSDEMTFNLLEGSFEVYKRLQQFNSYLFFYLLLKL